MKASEISKNVDLHNVEFYNLAPRTIHHLKSDVKLGLLAVARADNTIEIWNIESEAPIMVKTIFPLSVGKIEGLCWVQGELFTVDSQGQLITWDLISLSQRKVMRVTGTAATCIDTNFDQSLIVVGTEEGYLNLFNVSEQNGVLYEKLMDKQEGRIVCVKFDPSGKYLVTGNLDCVRVWDVSTGHVIHKMSVSRAEAKKPTIIWCVGVLDNLEIITGDSRGRVTVWDGKVGAQVQSLVASKVDILSLAVRGKQTFYCAGSDAELKTYSLVKMKKEESETSQWVRTFVRTFHSHDIMALDLYKARLYSGGQDAFLACSSYPPKISNTYTPLLPRPSVCVVDNRLIFFKHYNYIEVWKLGTQDTANVDDDNDYSIIESPKKILALKSKHGLPIIDAQISPNAKWIIYTTETFSKMFHFQYKPNQPPELTSIELPPEFDSARLITFHPNSMSLCVTKSNNTINFFKITESEVSYQQTIDVSKQFNETIRQLQFSVDGKYLACLSATSDIVLYKHQKNVWKHLMHLPKHTSVATCMRFRPDANRIVVAFADQKIYEYDFEHGKFTMTTNVYFGNSRYPIVGVVFDPRQEGSMLLETEIGFYLLKRISEDDDDDVGAGLFVKRTKTDKIYKDTENQAIVKLIKNYEHLMHLSWMGESELVAVHASTLQFVEQLPPAFRKKKFGVS